MPPSKKAHAARDSRSRRASPPTGRLRRVVRALLLLGLFGLLLGTSAAAGIFLYYTSDDSLPTLDKVGDYHPKVVTRVLGRDGTLIGEIFEERRTVVPRDRIPKVLIQAIVDAEDAEFFEHGGLSYWGMLRAFLHDLRPGAHLHGASTITQQLVRTYVLKSDARTLRRKIQEMYLATRIERHLTKDEILWIYLNQIYLGHNRYGVEEISRFFFGKSVSDIGPAEAALLASLPKGPEEISPRHHPDRAKDRRAYVLSQMVRYKHLAQDEATRLASEPIRLIRDPGSTNLAPEFTDEVAKLLLEKYGADKVPYLGLNVRTSCDPEVQRAARAALERGLQRIDEDNGNRGGLRLSSAGPGDPKKHAGGGHRPLTAAEQRAHLLELKKKFPSGPPQDTIIEGVVLKVLNGDGTSGAGAQLDLGAVQGWLPLPQTSDREARSAAVIDRYNPKGLMPQKRFVPGDVLRVRIARSGKDGAVLALENGPQGAVVVIEPDSRQVLAMVGGYGFTRGNFNRALRAKRQPGSSFKPFVYATAFDSRKYTPASILNDSPQVYDLPGMAPWKPHNAERHEYQGPVRLRVALARSMNTVASQIIYDLKPDPVKSMAQSLGIESALESNYSLALGTSEVRLIELVNAYATLAARGRHGVPLTVVQLGDNPPEQAALSQVVSPELAFVVSQVLQSVIEEGTGQYAKGKLGRPAAGKTGTTNSQKDAWFVGYTPDVCAGVWVGYDDMRVLGEKEQGARAALPIWVEVMQAALKGRRVVPFVQPPGVVVERIDRQSGKLAAPGGAAMDEVFLDGTQPTEQALSPGEEDPNKFNMEQEE